MDVPSRLSRPTLRQVRFAVVAIVVLMVALLAHSYLTYGAAAGASGPGTDRTLVVTIDGTGPGQIIAYGPSGNVKYRNESLWLYHDVDPSPVESGAVSYVGSEVVNSSHPECPVGKCMHNVVERANLSTGAVTRRYDTARPLGGSTQTHDVDWVNDSVLAVADISFPDRVYMVNVTSDEVIWQWKVSEAFGKESGGAYPSDWTHVNDVEVLADGRLMVNLRNQDQVVFIEPGEGIQPNWTLGSDDNHTRLYEQHNADYIPASRGGPAVLVADSENNRIVEYQRANGSWTRSWTWSDARLQWPRDADRLPNGNTLIVDSHGSRLLSVAPDGSIAWSHPFPDGGYDAEVLGTGDESSGPSAVRANLTSRQPGGGLALTHMVVSLVPSLILHGLLAGLPIWADTMDALAVLLAVPTLLCWLLIEAAVRLSRRRAE